MPTLTHVAGSLLLGLALVSLSAGAAQASGTGASVRLYTLDCGRIDTTDLSAFSDTGEYDGRGGSLSAPCFLITHAKGILLWDTGLGDEIAATQGGIDVDPTTHIRVDTTLHEQLAALGKTESDVTHIAFSHLHFDHTGNAKRFTSSSWILNKRELAWARSEEARGLVDLESLANFNVPKQVLIDGDHDVFGDGSVRILRTPGHTPGHQVLLIRLANAGNVILSGDLYHTKENEKEGRVPSFNVNRADTLASFDRVARLLRNKRARLYVQHAPEDVAALPRFPAYLD
ncbi:MAG: N-acyl homoserine lactonase family protein [Polyangiales bacterium]